MNINNICNTPHFSGIKADSSIMARRFPTPELKKQAVDLFDREKENSHDIYIYNDYVKVAIPEVKNSLKMELNGTVDFSRDGKTVKFGLNDGGHYRVKYESNVKDKVLELLKLYRSNPDVGAGVLVAESANKGVFGKVNEYKLDEKHWENVKFFSNLFSDK